MWPQETFQVIEFILLFYWWFDCFKIRSFWIISKRYAVNAVISASMVLSVLRGIPEIFFLSSETEFSAVHFINYTIPILCLT